ncbi:hypothetical protein LZS85_04575 [Aliivibrio fischeri]|uniref:hypothetical protein n=1 Tax=Aliivibrio fischeri TaxID=668 RepID=UPI001F299AC5|nr:hypothetical protein [Aliivibrio fischeri]MCE7565373.1 hypothetical protein [Aliivibrio fischeri]
MQFNNSKLVNLIYDTNLNLEKLVLNNSPTDHERYLFSKIELEVRVHEFIRTVYYKNGKIPTELNEFYNEVAEFMKKDLTSENLGSDLISLSHTISLSAYDFLLLNNETISNKEMLKLWKEKEREMFDKFICDILFVCYIKLIQYYGYLDLSKKLGNTVNFPNLYNQIYETNL